MTSSKWRTRPFEWPFTMLLATRWWPKTWTKPRGLPTVETGGGPGWSLCRHVAAGLRKAQSGHTGLWSTSSVVHAEVQRRTDGASSRDDTGPVQGEMINESGTMSGGGGKPREGRMCLGKSAACNVDSKQAAAELASSEASFESGKQVSTSSRTKAKEFESTFGQPVKWRSRSECVER